jgi:hypothetical protein
MLFEEQISWFNVNMASNNKKNSASETDWIGGGE